MTGKKKPDGVHPDAKEYGDRWLLRRSSEYVREWDSQGRLINQTDGRVETRFDIKGRLASRGEWAELPGGKHIRPHGLWEYGPEEGPVRRESIYNLGVESLVPEAQIAFYCFNYGDLSATSYAAGLPWLALDHAREIRGWRRKSRVLLDAVARARGS